MRLIHEFKSKKGQIKVFIAEEENSIQIFPKGYISKQLLQSFLEELKVMDELQINRSKHHIVDTSEVVFANPLNPFYLRVIKKLIKKSWYIVVVPNPILRVFVRLTRWINNPDFVFKSMEDCQIFLKEQQNTE